MTDKGTRCNHAGSISLEISGALVGWCPHCGAFHGPARMLEAIATAVGKSNPLSPKPAVFELTPIPGVRTPEATISPFGRKAPIIIGGH
jgi:hypothetical protein